MKEIFIEQDGYPKGPFTLDELKSVSISRDTLVWFEGMQTWQEVQKIPDLQILFSSVPPPLPHGKKETSSSNNEGRISTIASNDIGLASKKSNREFKEGLLSRSTKKVIANEAIITWRVFKYSTLIGILSYGIWGYKGFKALYLREKYNLEGVGSYAIDNMEGPIKREIVSLVSKENERYGYFTSFWNEPDGIRWWYSNILQYHIDELTTSYLGYSVLTGLVTFVGIIIIRYFTIGTMHSIKWVNKNRR